MGAYYNCMRCMNQRVRIWTRDGCIHEGRIVRVDSDNVYMETDRRDGSFGTRNSILTLSLFTLLAIALI
ncbi:hypothetical protein [Paenibacillus lutimineralis]|uniref:Cellobiose phosphorylase n=1 Tax=Paenibacillus lutimineralis TaxID=2707005 RepID=A0A3S9UYL0_9BACL|nr:hypothetical protein [Paenibacillus lutimineralis]AZS15380.1 hypothetical protein EI981_13505 [Paenibacillus lutimineralis]